MQTISVSCSGSQFVKIELCLKKMFAAMKRSSGRKKYSEGMRDLFIFMLKCTSGRDFTYVTLKRLEEELGVHSRTVERWLKKFIEDGWITKGAKFVDGYMRSGFFLLAHSSLLNILTKIKGIAWRKHDEEQEAETIDIWESRKKISEDFGRLDLQGYERRRKIDACRPADVRREKDENSSIPTGDGEILGTGIRTDSERNQERPVGVGKGGFDQAFERQKNDSFPGGRCATPVHIQDDLTRQVVGNLPELLTIRSDFYINSPLPPSMTRLDEVDSGAAGAAGREKKETGKDFFEQDETDNHPIWLEARKELFQRNPRFMGLLRQFTGRMTDSGLAVEGPNVIVTNLIERELSREIGEVLEGLGISSFSFGIQPSELREKLEQAALKREQLQQEELERRQATAAVRSAAVEAKHLNNLTPEQQFAALAAAYPRKSVYGEYFARNTFIRLFRRGCLPDMASLLRILNQHKTSVDWNRDGGRWIPGLNKWLKAQPWISSERQYAETTWLCTGGIH
ncbi:MAG: helix-turn-helix domain-containing protein [Desulfobulbus sp.]|jgi:hypothetical protein|uniref:hypothetical protein n=1 Tax=Desulfobulbus sp. TaxID=895 RepID=UPI0028445742|nr:hypothetical protein [Desulfobulbus sp.]MDR2549112.1 helix-turn-helix domain-containing protein [Desulfobulbus sp.]